MELVVSWKARLAAILNIDDPANIWIQLLDQLAGALQLLAHLPASGHQLAGEVEGGLGVPQRHIEAPGRVRSQVETVRQVTLQHDRMRAEQPVHAPGDIETLGERGDGWQDGVGAQQHKPVLLENVGVPATSVLGTRPAHRLADQHIAKVVALLCDAEERDQLQHVDDVTGCARSTATARCRLPTDSGEGTQRPEMATVVVLHVVVVAAELQTGSDLGAQQLHEALHLEMWPWKLPPLLRLLHNEQRDQFVGKAQHVRAAPAPARLVEIVAELERLQHPCSDVRHGVLLAQLGAQHITVVAGEVLQDLRTPAEGRLAKALLQGPVVRCVPVEQLHELHRIGQLGA
uniref:Uncharacterized protein n=1 Tax=Anopheles atroparvus TaxID=41427 RepID=A0A182IUT8_ANOAO